MSDVNLTHVDPIDHDEYELALAELRRQRDQARDIACALEERLAAVEQVKPYVSPEGILVVGYSALLRALSHE